MERGREKERERERVSQRASHERNKTDGRCAKETQT
jgi:hypothetical protein